MEKGYEDVLKKQKVSEIIETDTNAGLAPSGAASAASYTYGNGGCYCICDGCGDSCCCSDMYYTSDGQHLCYSCYVAWIRAQENGNDKAEPETPVGDGGNCFRCVECGQCCSCGNISPYDKNGNSVCMACYVQLPHCQNCGAPTATVDRYSQDPSYCDTCGKAMEITIHGVSEMLVNESHIFDVSNAYGNNVSVTWSTTTPEILNVTAYGSVSALKPGAGVVIATLNSNGRRFRYFVEVKFVCEECGERLSANRLSTLPNICTTCYAALPVCDACGNPITTRDRHPSYSNVCAKCVNPNAYETYEKNIVVEGKEITFRVIMVNLNNIKPEIIVNKIKNTSFFGINGSFFEAGEDFYNDALNNCIEAEDAEYPDESSGVGISWNVEYVEPDVQAEIGTKAKNYIYNGNNTNKLRTRDTLVIYRDTITNQIKYKIRAVHEVDQVEEYFENNVSNYEILRMIGGGTMGIGLTTNEWLQKIDEQELTKYADGSEDYRCGIGIKLEGEYKAYLVQSCEPCALSAMRELFGTMECENAIFLDGGGSSQSKWKENGITHEESYNNIRGVPLPTRIIWNMVRIIDASVMD